MTTKELLINAINHRNVPYVPLMYRADPIINKRLLSFFGLKDLEEDWEVLIQKLGADNFSDGETLGAFTSYIPKYKGPTFNAVYEINHFFIWGIKPVLVEVSNTTDIVFHKNPPLYNLDNISDVLNYQYPKVEWFDFNTYKVASDAIYQDFNDQKEIDAKEIKKSQRLFQNTYTMNSIFMTSLFIRGIENMMVDLICNKKYAEILIGNIGEFYLEFCRKNLSMIGNSIDLYGIWDDFATQNDLMISAEIWRKFYKPWHKKIIEIAKGYNIFVCFHICGNCSEVIPDLIDMGVDILDPVQTSAKNMEIDRLKSNYGKDICFHGGLDAQKLIPFGEPEQIQEEMIRIKRLFGHDGGIILGPSHYITADTTVENILAIYRK
jgi:uroporphyrinogen decarboxylase